MKRPPTVDRKSTRLNSSHLGISYAVFWLKKKKSRTRLLRRPIHLPPWPPPRRSPPTGAATVPSPQYLVTQVGRMLPFSELFFFLMERRPPGSTPFSLHYALPI